jgi:hypothetical protein
MTKNKVGESKSQLFGFSWRRIRFVIILLFLKLKKRKDGVAAMLFVWI